MGWARRFCLYTVTVVLAVAKMQQLPSLLLQLALWLGTLPLLPVRCGQYDKCGAVNQDPAHFAIDGDGADIIAPWIAALGVKKDWDKDGFPEFNVQCSGSILTPNIVISAAHCFDQAAVGQGFNVTDLIVRAGATRIESDKHQEIEIEHHVKHEKYNDPNIYFDISLVKLAQNLIFNQRVQAICLPSAPTPIGGGVLVTVQGWGKSSEGYRGELTQINVASRLVSVWILWRFL